MSSGAGASAGAIDTNAWSVTASPSTRTVTETVAEVSVKPSGRSAVRTRRLLMLEAASSNARNELCRCRPPRRPIPSVAVGDVGQSCNLVGALAERDHIETCFGLLGRFGRLFQRGSAAAVGPVGEQQCRTDVGILQLVGGKDDARRRARSPVPWSTHRSRSTSSSRSVVGSTRSSATLSKVTSPISTSAGNRLHELLGGILCAGELVVLVHRVAGVHDQERGLRDVAGVAGRLDRGVEGLDLRGTPTHCGCRCLRPRSRR